MGTLSEIPTPCITCCERKTRKYLSLRSRGFGGQSLMHVAKSDSSVQVYYAPVGGF